MFIILSLIVGGFLLGTGSWEHFGQTVSRTSNRPLSVEFMIQLLWVMVGYSGWNAATYVAEELRRPDHTLPKALTFGTLIVAVLYLGLNLVFIYATPPNDLRDVVAVGQIAAKNLFGDGIAVVFSALMAISLMATVNAMVTIGPRVYYAMAQNGLFPKAAARLHPKWRTPIVAIPQSGDVRDTFECDSHTQSIHIYWFQSYDLHGARGCLRLYLPPENSDGGTFPRSIGCIL